MFVQLILCLLQVGGKKTKPHRFTHQYSKEMNEHVSPNMKII